MFQKLRAAAKSVRLHVLTSYILDILAPKREYKQIRKKNAAIDERALLRNIKEVLAFL